MNTLIILSGIAGSGKSTWARKFKIQHPNTVYISRDAIRFSMLREGDAYFSHEKEVKAVFYAMINNNLKKKIADYIIVDATHLNAGSRTYLLSQIQKNLDGWQIMVVCLDTDVEECVRRDMHRTGRAHVTEKIIRNMSDSFEIPTQEEITLNNYNRVEIWQGEKCIILKGDKK